MIKEGFLYKEKKSKKGQVTLFIIIAILILAVMLIVFYPRLKGIFVPKTPAEIVDTCTKIAVDEALEKVSLQGGSIQPTLYFAYQGNNVEYLCYTNQNYKTCVMQQPMLKQHVEREIKDYVEPKARACVEQLRTEMEAKGYDVSVRYDGTEVSIVPNNILVNVNANVVLRKEGTETFNRFSVSKPSKLYELIMLTTSILNFEARYGDSETTTYMFYYPNIRVEKLKQDDGSKIYILTDTTTQEKFNFATRSLAWPGGYKLSL